MAMSEAVATKPAAERSTWFQGKLWFWGPVGPLVALDLWSKAAAFAAVAAREPRVFPQERREWHLIETEVVGFSLVQWTNPGTVWGLLQNFNSGLTILRIVAVPLLIYFAFRTAARHRLQLLVLGMILAGALGNLWDNLTQTDGAVRDFLLFYAWWGGEKHVFPAFNVADSCITVGAITLAVLLWRTHDDGA